MNVVEGGDSWQADLNIVMNYTMRGISLLVEELVAS